MVLIFIILLKGSRYMPSPIHLYLHIEFRYLDNSYSEHKINMQSLNPFVMKFYTFPVCFSIFLNFYVGLKNCTAQNLRKTVAPLCPKCENFHLSKKEFKSIWTQIGKVQNSSLSFLARVHKHAASIFFFKSVSKVHHFLPSYHGQQCLPQLFCLTSPGVSSSSMMATRTCQWSRTESGYARTSTMTTSSWPCWPCSQWPLERAGPGEDMHWGQGRRFDPCSLTAASCLTWSVWPQLFGPLYLTITS